MSVPESLVIALRDKRVVPFVGAGVSMGVKRGLFPSWRQLLEALRDKMRREQVAPDDADKVGHLIAAGEYVRAAEIGYNALGQYRFHGFLRERFRQRRQADLDLAAVESLWQLEPPLVITTNYDSVLRWAGPDTVQVVANDQSEELALIREARSDWPWIWHLHGTIERMATVILASADYKRLYQRDERARDQIYEQALFTLQNTLASRSLLYIGFGLGDPYVLEQISHVLDLTRGNVAPSFALMKRGEANRGDLWQNYNIQLIEYADHGQPLIELLRELRRQAFGADTAPAGNAMGSGRPERSVATKGGDSGLMPRGDAMGGADQPSPRPGPPRAPSQQPSSPVTTKSPVPAADASPWLPGTSDAERTLETETAASAAEAEDDSVKASTADLEGYLSAGPQSYAAPKLADKDDSTALDPSSDMPSRKPLIKRTQWAKEFGTELMQSRRLLLLAPRGGGAHTLAREVAATHFGDRVMWLSPPNVPHASETEYCSWLSETAHVGAAAGVPGAYGQASTTADDRPPPPATDFMQLVRWIEGHARSRGGELLVVLRHDAGPLAQLSRLGDLLRSLVEESRPGARISVLVAGQAQVAKLRYEALETSLFSGAPVRHVPRFSRDEVAQVLAMAGRDRGAAAEVLHATGGLPGLVVEAIAGGAALDREAITARLVRSSAVRARLRRRIADDDRERISPTRHARATLRALREGREVRRLGDIEDEFAHAEIRLYYDGLVMADDGGDTVFLCPAVRRATEDLFVLDAGVV